MLRTVRPLILMIFLALSSVPAHALETSLEKTIFCLRESIALFARGPVGAKVDKFREFPPTVLDYAKSEIYRPVFVAPDPLLADHYFSGTFKKHPGEHSYEYAAGEVPFTREEAQAVGDLAMLRTFQAYQETGVHGKELSDQEALEMFLRDYQEKSSNTIQIMMMGKTNRLYTPEDFSMLPESLRPKHSFVAPDIVAHARLVFHNLNGKVTSLPVAEDIAPTERTRFNQVLSKYDNVVEITRFWIDPKLPEFVKTTEYLRMIEALETVATGEKSKNLGVVMTAHDSSRNDLIEKGYQASHEASFPLTAGGGTAEVFSATKDLFRENREAKVDKILQSANFKPGKYTPAELGKLLAGRLLYTQDIAVEKRVVVSIENTSQGPRLKVTLRNWNGDILEEGTIHASYIDMPVIDGLTEIKTKFDISFKDPEVRTLSVTIPTTEYSGKNLYGSSYRKEKNPDGTFQSAVAQPLWHGPASPWVTFGTEFEKATHRVEPEVYNDTTGATDNKESADLPFHRRILFRETDNLGSRLEPHHIGDDFRSIWSSTTWKLNDGPLQSFTTQHLRNLEIEHESMARPDPNQRLHAYSSPNHLLPDAFYTQSNPAQVESLGDILPTQRAWSNYGAQGETALSKVPEWYAYEHQVQNDVDIHDLYSALGVKNETHLQTRPHLELENSHIEWNTPLLKSQAVTSVDQAKAIVARAFHDPKLEEEFKKTQKDSTVGFRAAYENVMTYADGYQSIIESADHALPSRGKILVYGLDADQLAARLSAQHPERKIEAHTQIPAQLPTQADGILLSNMFSTFNSSEEKDALVRRIFPSLKEGGTLIMNDYSQLHLEPQEIENVMTQIAVSAVQNGSPMTEKDLAFIALENKNLPNEEGAAFWVRHGWVPISNSIGLQRLATHFEFYARVRSEISQKKPAASAPGEEP